MFRSISLVFFLFVIKGSTQVKLGEVTVPRDHIIVFLAIGHSNLQSAHAALASDTTVFVGVDSRIWNYNIGDQYDTFPHHTWIPAREPVHQRNNGIIECYGPSMPFLKNILAKLPKDYYLGIIQNGEGRAQLKKHYVDNNKTDYGTYLYSQIKDAVTALDTTVTWGGVFTMIGLVERKNESAANNFSVDMDTLMVRLRELTKTPDLPLLVTQYEKGATQDCAIDLYYGLTIESQINSIPSLISNSFVIPTDWTTDSAKYMNDNHHFNPDGHLYWAQLAAGIYDDEGLLLKYTVDTINPDAPTNVSIDSITCTGAFLSWSSAYDNVKCKYYHVASSQGFDTTIFDTVAALPIRRYNDSLTFTLHAVDFSSNKSSTVSVSRSYTLDCLPVPDDFKLVKSTTTSLTVQWSYSDSCGTFIVSINDSVAVTTDSFCCTLSNLLPGSVYSIKIVYKNSSGETSKPGMISCTTKAIQVASIPLYVDLAGSSHGRWVADNIWSDSVSHGLEKPLQKDSFPINSSADESDTVMATIYEGEMHYIIRVPKNDYALTIYCNDPFEHDADRIFLLSMTGNDTVDSVITSPGKRNSTPWSEKITLSLRADSIIRIYTKNKSSLSPLVSGFSLAYKCAFTVTVPDTIVIGDTMHIKWDSNTFLVGSATIYASPNKGKTWTLITTDAAIGTNDPSWGHFKWVAPVDLGGQEISGVDIVIKIADYNNDLYGSANCHVCVSSSKEGPKTISNKPVVSFRNTSIYITGDYRRGTSRIFGLDGRLVTSRNIHAPGKIDLGKLSGGLYMVEIRLDGVKYLHKILGR